VAVEIATTYDLDALNGDFERFDALDIIDWGVREFGDDLAVSSSFGADSAVMLHLATRVKPDIKVVTVDTGFLFPETLTFRDMLKERLNLNMLIYRRRWRESGFSMSMAACGGPAPMPCCASTSVSRSNRASASWVCGAG